jgi:hypothetical protein
MALRFSDGATEEGHLSVYEQKSVGSVNLL